MEKKTRDREFRVTVGSLTSQAMKMEEVLRFGHIFNGDLKTSGAYTEETENLESSAVGRMPSEVIASGNALWS